MKRTQPAWLDTKLFPFESKWIDVDGETLHYVDEGQGQVILFAHGTPEWSFGYRELIRSFRPHYRCIAIDMLGFGLSEKKTNADYTCQAHAVRLEKIIGKLQLKNIAIVANDFGGSIAMSYAIRHPENIHAIILFNTWMWSLKHDKHFTAPVKTINSWFGRTMYLTFNAPVNLIMPMAFGKRERLTREIHAHYKKALQQGERTAAYAFAKELMNASDWWQELWEKADLLKGKKMLFFWGLKDKFVLPKELEKWRSKFPDAKVISFEDAGHFVQEEKAGQMVSAIYSLLRD
ncbi:MAG TPA: alpha/beta fold hydrolase [Chryseosolibacter sp.]